MIICKFPLLLLDVTGVDHLNILFMRLLNKTSHELCVFLLKLVAQQLLTASHVLRTGPQLSVQHVQTASIPQLMVPFVQASAAQFCNGKWS